LVTINSEIVRRVGGDTKRVEAADSLFYGCFVLSEFRLIMFWKLMLPKLWGTELS